MLEVSIHKNSKKVFDYKKNKSIKLFGIAGLLAIPSSIEVQKLLENADKAKVDYETTLKAFDESIKSYDTSISEVNKLLDKCEYMIDNAPATTQKIDISNTGKFKDWLLNKNIEVPRLNDIGEVNGEWITSQLQQEVEKSGWELAQEDIHSIAEFLRGVGKFCGDVKWCIQNPAHASYIVIEWLIKYGTWAVILYIVYQLLLLAYTSGRVETEVTIKIKNRISITAIVYIALLILEFILKLYLGI